MTSSDSRLASIVGEWRSRLDDGEEVDPEHVIAENPDLEDELRAQFDALSQMRHAQATKNAPTELRTLPIDRYGEFKPAGEGGMGIVYWAIDTDLNREVAFKIIRPQGGEGTQTPQRPADLPTPDRDTPASQAFETLKQRFLQEAWITSGMAHPGIVPVYELGQTPEGVPYYTMRFIKGETTLATAIEAAKAKGIEERLALLEPFLKICDAIRYAHSRGVIHRDLKPENVALGEFGEVVVLDWGLARVQGTVEPGGDRLAAHIQEYRDATDLRTVAGAMGTPGYMPPEAALGDSEKMDERSDVYSLGAILFEILTGRIPHEFTTFIELARKLLNEEPPRAVGIDDAVPEALSDLCGACLSRDMDERPDSADVLAKAIRGWQVEREKEREIEGFLREAKTAIEAAEGLHGANMLQQVDRAAAALSQVLSRRPDSARARALGDRADELREMGMREREGLARKRILVRGGIATIVVAAVAAVIIAGVLNAQREEADDARNLAQKSLAQTWIEQGRQELLALKPDRALVYLNAAYQAGEDGPVLRYLLAQALREVQREVHVLAGHEAPVVACDFSSDSKRLATSSLDRTARIWDVETGACLSVLEGHLDTVNTVRFSPDGARVLTVSNDRTARIWDAATGASLFTLEGHELEVRDGAFNKDGTRVVTGSCDRTARLWNAATGVAIAVLRVTVPPKQVPSRGGADGLSYSSATARFNPEGTAVVTSHLGTTAEIWDADAGVHRRTLTIEEGVVLHATFGSAGRVYTGASDGKAQVWDSRTGEVAATLHGMSGPVWHAVQGPSRVRVLTGNASEVRTWGSDGEAQATGAGLGGFPGSAGSFSPDDERVVSLRDDDTVAVWNASTGVTLAVLEHTDRVHNAKFSPDGKLIATCGFDGTARLWGGRTASLLSTASSSYIVKRSRCLSPDGRHMVGVQYTADDEEQVVLLDTRDGSRASVLARLGPDDESTDIITFSQGGGLVVSEMGNEIAARVYDVETGQHLCTFGDPSQKILNVALAPDGSRAAVLTSDGALTIRDVTTGDVLVRPPGNDMYIAPTFSRDGTRLAVQGTQLRILDPQSGEVLVTLAGPRFAAFSNDGTRILTTLSGVGGLRAQIWDTESGSLLQSLSADQMVADFAAFSPDGTQVLTAGKGDEARLFSAEDGTLLRRLPHDVAREFGYRAAGIQDGGPYPTFTADGRWVVTYSRSRTRAFDAQTGEPHAKLDWPSQTQFSPDGSRLLAARPVDGERAYRIWTGDGARVVSVLEGDDWVAISSYKFNRSGSRLLGAMYPAFGAKLWDTETGRIVAFLEGHTEYLIAWSLSQQGDHVVSVAADGTARFWDAVTGRHLATWGDPATTASGAILGPNDVLALTAAGPRTAHIRDARTGAVISELRVESDTDEFNTDLDSARFSPRGDRVATGGANVRIWDTATGKSLAALEHVDYVSSIDFSPDGTRIVTACADGLAYLWDVSSGAFVMHLIGHDDELLMAEYSSDGTRIVTCSADGSARLWDGDTGAALAIMDHRSDGVFAARFSADGTRIVTAHGDQAARIWDARGGKLLGSLSGHDGAVEDVMFSADGARLVTDSGSTRYLWDVQGEAVSRADLASLTRKLVPLRIEQGQLVSVVEQGTDDGGSMRQLERQVARVEHHGYVVSDLMEQGETDAALRRHRAALALAEQIVARAPTWGPFHDLLIERHESFASDLEELGDAEGVLEQERRALAVAEQVARRHPTSRRWQRELADRHEEVARSLAEADDTDGVVVHLEAALAARSSMGDSGLAEYWRIHLELARICVDRLDLEGAMAHHREILSSRAAHTARTGVVMTRGVLPWTTAMVALCRRRLDEAPEDQSRKRELADALEVDGDARVRTSQPLTASPSYQERLGLMKQLAEGDDASTDVRAALAEALDKYGWLLSRSGDRQGALEHCQEALALHERLVAERPEDLEANRALARCHEGVANILVGLDRREEARGHRVFALNLREAATQASSQPIYAWLQLGDARRRAGRYADAAEAFERALEMQPGSAMYTLLVTRRDAALLLTRVREETPPGPALMISKVVADTQAAKLGLEPGDVILSVKDVPVASLQQFREVWLNVAANETAVMVIRRAGRRIEVSPHGGRIGVTLFDLLDD